MTSFGMIVGLQVATAAWYLYSTRRPGRTEVRA
jgi:hypothetical protein